MYLNSVSDIAQLKGSDAPDMALTTRIGYCAHDVWLTRKLAYKTMGFYWS